MEWSEYDIKPEGTRGTMVLRETALALVRAGAGGRPTDAPVGEGEARYAVSTPLVGGFNVANTLTALGICLALGLDLERTLEALGDFRGVPGRMEPVNAGQDFTVLVDYAHTPDSVRNALHTARGFTRGRLVAVLGCGGDRDKGKRPLMGREAEEAADLLIVTSDNPRTEDPLAIIADITAGLADPERAEVQPDRRLAIRMAMAEARAGDVVLILGKGHEVRAGVCYRDAAFR